MMRIAMKLEASHRENVSGARKDKKEDSSLVKVSCFLQSCKAI